MDKKEIVSGLFVLIVLIVIIILSLFSSSLWDGSFGEEHFILNGEISVKNNDIAFINNEPVKFLVEDFNYSYRSTGVFVPLNFDLLSGYSPEFLEIKINESKETVITGTNLKVSLIGDKGVVAEKNLGIWKSERDFVNSKLFYFDNLSSGEYALKAEYFDNNNQSVLINYFEVVIDG